MLKIEESVVVIPKRVIFRLFGLKIKIFGVTTHV